MYSVLIRPITENDAEIFWKWQKGDSIPEAGDDVAKLEDLRKAERERLRRVLGDRKKKSFAILVDGLYVGNILLENITETSAQCNYLVGNEEFYGEGMVELAIRQCLHFAKHQLKLKKIYASIDQQNISQINEYKKAGFTMEEEDNPYKAIIDLEHSLSESKVSVFMLVYNHGSFIKEALEGVLKQKTNFDFELVIGEDCSTDNSRKIIQEYADIYPGKFKLFLHPQNIGPYKNQETVFNACNGEFIAYCEGDDHWTDMNKLQKQVDLLQSKKEVNICFHPVRIIDQEGSTIDISNKDTPVVATFEDLIHKNFVHTPSNMTRRKALPRLLPKWLHKVAVGDWPLLLIASSTGKLFRLEEVMAIYRIHEGGIWSQRSSAEYNYFGTKRALIFKKHFGRKYSKAFGRIAAQESASLLNANLRGMTNYKLVEAIYLYFITSTYRPFRNLFSPIKILLKRMVKLKNPLS